MQLTLSPPPAATLSAKRGRSSRHSVRFGEIERRPNEIAFDLSACRWRAPAMRGDTLFLRADSSQEFDGGPIIGTIGAGLDLTDAIVAAKGCALLMLAQIRQALGSLDHVEGFLTLTISVNHAPDFDDVRRTHDDIYQLLRELFGEIACPVQYVSTGPLSASPAAVEIEATVLITNYGLL